MGRSQQGQNKRESQLGGRFFLVALFLLTVLIFMNVWGSVQAGLVVQPLLVGIQVLAAGGVVLAAAALVLVLLGCWVDAIRKNKLVGCLPNFCKILIKSVSCTQLRDIRPPIFFS